MHFFRNILHWLRIVITGEEHTNFRAGLLCVFLAGCFWLLYALNGDYTTAIKYMVVFQDAKGNPLSNKSEQVLIDAKGSGWNLIKESFESRQRPILYTLYASDAKNYVISTDLKATIGKNMNPELKIASIQLDTFFIKADRKVRKKVKISLNSSLLSLAPNHRIISAIQVSPQYVVFEGDVAHVSKLTDSIMLVVRERNINQNFDKLISLHYLENQFVKAALPSIKVSFKVEKFVTKSQLVYIRRSNFPENPKIKLGTDFAEIIYVCKASDEEKIQVTEFEVLADYQKYNTGDSTLSLQLERIPQGVEEVKIQKSRIKLIYE